MTLPAARPIVKPALLATAFGIACVALSAPAADALILPDGFTIQGTGEAKQEKNPEGYSFHVLQDGPKYIIYSTHTRKGAKVEKNVPRPQMVAYTRKVLGAPRFKSPGYGQMTATEFDENWRRTVTIRQPDGNFHRVRQMIAYLDPYSCTVASLEHAWRLAFHTAEMDPDLVRKLLSTHPDLVEQPGQPDPAKRVAIAEFQKDAGWLESARKELDRARKDIPGAWDKELDERAAKVRTDCDIAETRIVLDEIEAAVASGRFGFAKKSLAAFTPKAADPKETTRLAVLKAQVETVQPKFDETYRLLYELIQRVTGGDVADAYAATAGGPVVPFAPRPKVESAVAGLIPAARAVLDELHPFTFDRVEVFTNLARQADQRAKAGRDATTGPGELLALAVTGWLKGKNGADPSVEAAGRAWATREMASAYLREPIINTRHGMLEAYLAAGAALSPAELAQIISLMPPPFAEDLTQPLGKEVPKAEANGVPGIFRRSTPGTNPTEYFLRLPPEYHHGRPYPLLLVLSHGTVPAEKVVGLLAPYADKFGYILAAPVWANSFDANYGWSGDDHPMVTNVLRDVLRRFHADADRVFPFGIADGANLAFDLGASHPDLFAGVVAFGPTPQPDLFMQYWRNTQVLPYYVVTGEMAGDSAQQLRKVYERWMPKGFPALLTQYRGRGIEWYGMEIPRVFDWLNRKTRARGTAALKLNNPVFEAWQTGRDAEDRFYWVGTTGIRPGHLFKDNAKKGWQPATITADIRPGNNVVINTLGTKGVVVWLEREMIDWTKPVRVALNGQAPIGYKPKEMQPDLDVMFEEIHRTGDRKVLMLGRLEFPTP